MNKLLEIIDSRIQKKIKNTNFLTSAPCVVKHIASDEAVTVSLISNGTILTVPNYSGSSLEVGESVQLFYFGNMLTDKNAYIGASLNKDGETSHINKIPLNIETGSLTANGAVLGYCYVEANQDINAALNFNAIVLGSTSSDISFEIYINNVKYDYEPIVTSHEGEYDHISFSLQIDLATDLNTIIIRGVGTGAITNVRGYIEGKDITVYPVYEETSASDYSYSKDIDSVIIESFRGNSLYPSIPEEIENLNVTILNGASFYSSDIKAVYIPNGVETIVGS